MSAPVGSNDQHTKDYRGAVSFNKLLSDVRLDSNANAASQVRQSAFVEYINNRVLIDVWFLFKIAGIGRSIDFGTKRAGVFLNDAKAFMCSNEA